ncbi:MAG: RidA family protein, partial [Sutterella wadsworthensis]|nr:RidA family protein [Sutterella wadsworthensis]
MKIEAKMRELGLRFPPLGAPGGLYAFARRTGNLVYVSGQTPDLGGVLQIKGVVGKDIDIPTAQKAAELAALNILAVLKVELGDLDRITQFVQVMGYVRCAEGFGDHPQVINGASQVFKALWGDAGVGTRIAIGANELMTWTTHCIERGSFTA